MSLSIDIISKLRNYGFQVDVETTIQEGVPSVAISAVRDGQRPQVESVDGPDEFDLEIALLRLAWRCSAEIGQMLEIV